MNPIDEINKVADEAVERIEALRKEAVEKEERKGRKWTPQDREPYYYIDSFENISEKRWENSSVDIYRSRMNNVFRTVKEAEQKKRDDEIRSMWNESGRGFKVGDYNHYATWSHKDQMIHFNAWVLFEQFPAVPWFEHFEDGEKVKNRICGAYGIDEREFARICLGVEDGD